MTRKTLILLTVFAILGSVVYAHSGQKTIVRQGAEQTNPAAENKNTAKTLPALPAAEPKLPQQKASTPHMEEIPHIHKFHKERVKKVKKHHSKYWFISQVILVLCHLSMLWIAWLHATH